MEKNNQPLIIAAMVIGATLIISLALIFTRSDNETEVPAESTVSENEAGEDENEDDSQQPDPQPDPDPQPAPDPAPDPQPQPGVLPPNWSSLTAQEKNARNPFNCNHETQWVSAEDGTCITKSDDAKDYSGIPLAVSAFIRDTLNEYCVKTSTVTTTVMTAPAPGVTKTTLTCESGEDENRFDDSFAVDIYVADEAASADVELLLREEFTPRPGFITPIGEGVITTCQWFGTIYMISTSPLLENSFRDDPVAVSGTWIRTPLFSGSSLVHDTVRQLLGNSGFKSYTNDLKDDRVIPEGYEISYGCGNFSIEHYSNAINL